MLLPLLFGSLLTQQTTATPNTSSATQFKKSSSLHFIENKGQIIDQYHNPRTDVDFKIPAGNGLNIFIGAGKIHYQWSALRHSSGYETTSLSSRPEWSETEWSGGTSSAQGDERVIMYRMDVTLLNANPDAEIVTEEKQPYYEQYYLTNTDPNGATAHT